jgi:two-component system chemotaxis response regulator CheY
MLNPPNRRHGDGESLPEPVVRVLLVDDDEHFRAWLSRLMRRLGFSVETATDGEHALEVLDQSPFDLVISDYEMPRMNGLELIRVIRATPVLAHQYAVMLTSHEELDAKISALTIGFDDFLTKSCTEVEVVAKVVAARRMVARNRLLSNAASQWKVLASRDELTGVAMRRTLTTEAERCLNEGRTVGLALIDLDNFKPINDSFGHLTGDRILRDVGALFLNRTRGKELIARFGGDEFVLLVIDLPIEDVIGASDRLIAEIESMQWTFGETIVTIKATAGIAHGGLLTNPTFEQILEAADRDLYAKKWLKKHPPDRPELYEYSDNHSSIVPLPSPNEARMRR